MAHDVSQLPFEQAVGELESILERIEQGEIGLEESLRQFRRGDALVKRCRAILDAAELQVRELAVGDDEPDGRDEDDDEAPDLDDDGAEGASR